MNTNGRYFPDRPDGGIADRPQIERMGTDVGLATQNTKRDTRYLGP